MTAFLDLFAGIGGFPLGAQWAGLCFDAHYYSEVDPYAISAYRLRFPNAIPLGDIRGIHEADLPAGEWIIAGGFPCQDISVAGKGAGLAGERSGLWYEYARIIGELRPRFAIMENVGALAFRGLDSVLGSLAALGYDAEWQDIRASDVGAPHRRERIWIVAYPCGDGCESDNGGRPLPNEDRNNSSEIRESFEQSGAIGLGSMADSPSERREERRIYLRPGQSLGTEIDAYRNGEEVCDPVCEGLSDRRSGPDRQRAYAQSSGTNSGRARDQWAAEPDICRVAHGVPARVDRLKCLGNSIVPQISELIFRQAAFDEWRVA